MCRLVSFIPERKSTIEARLSKGATRQFFIYILASVDCATCPRIGKIIEPQKYNDQSVKSNKQADFAQGSRMLRIASVCELSILTCVRHLMPFNMSRWVQR